MATENAWAVHVASRTTVSNPATITPGTTLGIRTLGRPTMAPTGTGLQARTDVRSPEGPGVRPVLGSRGVEVTFQTELYRFADTSNYQTTGQGPLWAGAGELTEGASSLVWTPTNAMARNGAASSASGLVPFDLQIDHIGGNRYVVRDCLATVSVAADAGGRILCSWTIRGEYVAPVASTLAYGVTVYDTQAPIVYVGATHNDGMAIYSAVSRWSLDMGTELVDRPDGASSLGMGGPLLAWPNPPTLSFSADSDDETAQSAWGDAYSVAQETLNIELTGFTLELGAAFATSPPTVAGDAFGVYEHAFLGEGAPGVTLTWS